ncbi:MAG: 50S ribosomal protein L10 [Candidatus Binataceae bacterium]
MRRDQKSAVVAQLNERLRRAKMALLSEYRGITVAESTDLRRRLRAARGEMRVAKNTLIRRAIKGTRFENLEPKLGGPVGLILSYDDPVEVAKTVASFRELGDRFTVRCGVLEGQELGAAEIQALATLPPREVVLAQLLGLLQAPATRLVRLLNEPASSLARLIDVIGQKRGAAEPAS